MLRTPTTLNNVLVKLNLTKPSLNFLDGFNTLSIISKLNTGHLPPKFVLYFCFRYFFFFQIYWSRQILSLYTVPSDTDLIKKRDKDPILIKAKLLIDGRINALSFSSSLNYERKNDRTAWIYGKKTPT